MITKLCETTLTGGHHYNIAMLTLGLGCIGIGRKWGVTESAVPSGSEAVEFLHKAYELGIRYFDTAPAYGYSEERLGKFYAELSKEEQPSVTIATKLGEFWNFETSTAYRDFSYEKLKESIDSSLKLLGRIDILQLHGFTKEVWEKNKNDITRSFEYARSLGVKQVGASISNPNGAAIVFSKDDWTVIQFPHNILRPYDQNVIKEAQQKKKNIVINRPFAMGEIAAQNSEEAKRKAYSFVVKDIKDGVMLTGTKSVQHLKENLSLFEKALSLK